MESFIELIEKKIKDKIEVETIKIIDNSFKHKKHKSFEKNKLHLEMIIYSRYLRSLNKIQAHKEVMKILKDELKEKVHALELKIK
tara:strand:+ start:8055 stop:8309 length:255 start_codon:yes stop_codon:yes gene_type:complete